MLIGRPGRTPAAIALAGVAAALLSASAQAARGVDPDAVALGKVMKTQIQRSYQAKVPGIRFTRVTCTLVKNHTSGHCVARFTRASQQLNGVYQVALVVDTSTGGVQWRATSVACTDSKTGAKVKC